MTESGAAASGTDQTRLVLRAGRGQIAKVLLILAGWFALGGSLILILVFDDDPGGGAYWLLPKSVIWAICVVWLLLGLLVAVLLLRRLRRAPLVLDPRGLTDQLGIIRPIFVPWSEIDDIYVFDMGLYDGVALRLANPEVAYAAIPRVLRWSYRMYRPTFGWDVFIPGRATSLPTDQLAQLLREWRARHAPMAAPFDAAFPTVPPPPPPPRPPL